MMIFRNIAYLTLEPNTLLMNFKQGYSFSIDCKKTEHMML